MSDMEEKDFQRIEQVISKAVKAEVSEAVKAEVVTFQEEIRHTCRGVDRLMKRM